MSTSRSPSTVGLTLEGHCRDRGGGDRNRNAALQQREGISRVNLAIAQKVPQGHGQRLGTR